MALLHMESVSSSQSWADLNDEAFADGHAAAEEEADVTVASTPEGQLCESQGMAAAPYQADMASAGSALHRAGRCKPCAFYHTKGCQNDGACQFCHLCPPGEKQRRKRLRERMCEKLGQCFPNQSPFDQVDRRFKPGHLRQASGASTGASTASTASCGGWSKFSHSRQSSASSVAPSAPELGAVGNPHMHQMTPVPYWIPETGSTNETWTANAAGAGHMAPPWQPTGVFANGCPYAMIAVPMPQQHMDPSNPYACFAPEPQMQANSADSMQWCVQGGMQYSQPTWVSTQVLE